MSDSNVSILDKYRQTKPEKQSQTDSKEYKAYGIDPPRNRTPMIRIDYADGTRELMSKHYRGEWSCTSSQYLSLVVATGSIPLQV